MQLITKYRNTWSDSFTCFYLHVLRIPVSFMDILWKEPEEVDFKVSLCFLPSFCVHPSLFLHAFWCVDSYSIALHNEKVHFKDVQSCKMQFLRGEIKVTKSCRVNKLLIDVMIANLFLNSQMRLTRYIHCFRWIAFTWWLKLFTVKYLFVHPSYAHTKFLTLSCTATIWSLKTCFWLYVFPHLSQR